MIPRSLDWITIVTLFCLAALRPGLGQTAGAGRQSYRDERAGQFKKAIADSNLNQLRSLLSTASSNDCLEVDEEGGTALQYAVRRCVQGNANAQAFQVLEELARRTNCINSPDRLGRRPIMDLGPLDWMDRPRMDALNILIAHGADVNVQDANGMTLLHQLLGSWTSGSLHWPDVLQVLLGGKANPNIPNSAGETPMHAFFGANGFCTNRGGMVETKIQTAQKVFDMLTAAGADLTVQDHTGTTPVGTLLLQDEPFFGTKEVILGFTTPATGKALHVDSAQIKHRPALIYLCDEGKADADMVARLIELGVKANQAERDGFTALHAAAWFYNYRVCALLLGHGANANAQDDKGHTALHELVRSTYWNSGYFGTDRGANLLGTADVLLSNGADKRVKDRDGKTALDLLKSIKPVDEEMIELSRQLRKKLR